MKKYDHGKIEKKWQKEWLKKGTFEAESPRQSASSQRESAIKPKFYGLIEFPYPSGDGLHVGHPRPYIGMDIISRKRRMEGFNVLYPIGWDAFGLPTENYAIKTGKSPELVTKENTDTFRRQIQSLGVSFDWSREINTTDPAYYKWTQWIFLQMFKSGLAYKKKMTINWCPKDKIGLANEEVINGCCERCGTPVEKREKEQWMLAITKYADRLDRDLDTVDYLPQIKLQQRNWIGRSEGAEISFELKFANPEDNARRGPDGKPAHLEVFTTRPDTLFGVTYIVLSPEHIWVTLATDASHDVLENKKEVIAYVQQAKKKDDIDRTDAKKEKTGVELKGVKAINPATGEEIPMWVADYVLADYGTGAVMAVPAHDERDFEFAKKYNLPIKYVLAPRMVDHTNPHREGKQVVFRNAIIAVVRNPETGQIINLKWKKQPWTTFVMGGVEDGEDVIEAARREIVEETGYKNITFVRMLGGPVQSEFFAAHKDANRIAHTSQVLFELENTEHDELSDEESAIHEVVWVDPQKIVAKDMAHVEAPLVLERLQDGEKPYIGEGIVLHSGKFTRMTSEEAKKAITESVGGKIVTTYKLRDWVFSRQRYWGEPIPLIFCAECAKRAEGNKQTRDSQGEACKKRVESWTDADLTQTDADGERLNPGWIPVPEKDLPVELPKVEKYQPTDTGESPLADISEWVNVKCPQCGGEAKRETDTMPNWAGSSWYYLAYMSQGISNFQFPISQEIQDYWFHSTPEPKSYKLEAGSVGPVDWYNGGMEHTTLHLLYSRFWHKFLFDQGLVPTSEPYKKRTSHGLILAEGGEKMSKSKGNVVNPDEIVANYGADSLRLYEMFMGPFDQAIPWSTESIIGVRRFLEKVWRLQSKVHKVIKSLKSDSKTETLLNQTISKVSNDIEGMKFNTAISSMMILVNAFEDGIKNNELGIQKGDFEIFLKLLSPFAPHIAEEIWHELGHENSITHEPWPLADESKMQESEVTIVVQINGKVRGQVLVPIDSSEEVVLTLVKQNESVNKWLSTGDPQKIIFVPNRLINLVI